MELTSFSISSSSRVNSNFKSRYVEHWSVMASFCRRHKRFNRVSGSCRMLYLSWLWTNRSLSMEIAEYSSWIVELSATSHCLSGKISFRSLCSKCVCGIFYNARVYVYLYISNGYVPACMKYIYIYVYCIIIFIYIHGPDKGSWGSAPL